MRKTIKLERPRYVAFTYGYHRSLTQKELWRLISTYVNIYFGMKGTIRMGLYLHYVSSLPFAIIRVSSLVLDDFLMILLICRQFGNKPIVFYPIKSSGTLKGLQELEKANFTSKIVNIFQDSK
ncbi:MAG: Rpp14/Pop5 family protein [Candidatus Thorarchaeota archaeon]